jgi:predicted nuclease of predicted toxin-antitoxin system
MRLLADENMDALIVAWLRHTGHDVVWVAELSPAITDSEVLALAQAQSRIVLTNDRDFGEAVFRRGEASAGIILLRLRARLQLDRLELVKAHWPAVQERAAGHFVVVTNRKIRVRPLGPAAGG